MPRQQRVMIGVYAIYVGGVLVMMAMMTPQVRWWLLQRLAELEYGYRFMRWQASREPVPEWLRHVVSEENLPTEPRHRED